MSVGGLPAIGLAMLVLSMGCGRLGFGLSAVHDTRMRTSDAAAGNDAPDAAASSPDSGSLDAGAADSGSALDSGATQSDAGRSHVTALLRGFGHMCFISDGAMACWGFNDSGELGVGDTQKHDTPVPVPGSWLGGCGGEAYSCAIQQGGALYCWGDNAHGQLGLGDLSARTEPTHVAGIEDWTAVSCIGAFTCAIRRGGAIYCWGDNSEGALAQADAMGSGDVTTPQPIASSDTFREISTGQGDACAIRDDGALFCWGRNTSGQLGLGDGSAAQLRYPERVGSDAWSTLGVGQEHSCAIRSDGSLWCWGSNVQLPLGYATAANALVKSPMQVGSMTDWHQVSASRLDSCAITNAGAAYCWGRGAEGQIGNGNFDNQAVPTRAGNASGWREIAVSYFYICALRPGDSVWCWGKNDLGQLGLGDSERHASPTRLTFP